MVNRFLKTEQKNWKAKKMLRTWISRPTELPACNNATSLMQQCHLIEYPRQQQVCSSTALPCPKWHYLMASEPLLAF